MADLFTRLQAGLAGRYALEREVGRGGMATVYLARDLRHRRPVALKVLHPELAYAVGADRFLREIEVAANLSHPHILPLFDSGEVHGVLFYVMPYVEGESLKDRLAEGRQLPVDEALRIAREVGDALAYAHSQGIVHRDIKPGNILLSGGHALVADFGIARLLESPGESLTETGLAVGTLAYMSPEQASGERSLDGRSDVYSLGSVLYEMLAGEPPFSGPTFQATIARLMVEEPVPLGKVRPGVPAAVAAAVSRALGKRPSDRFASATEFVGALDGVGRSPTAGRSRGARPWVIGGSAAAAVLLVITGLWLTSLKAGLPRPPVAAGDQRPIVAVMPFRDLSPDSSQEYFAAGMSEEITAQVSRIAALRVMSPGATASYGDGPDRLQRMAQLGVGSIVEGTTRRAGEVIRIGVSLTDTRSGQVQWSDNFDGNIRDVFDVQGTVARQIAAALGARLSPVEAGRVGRRGTADPGAYDLYLRARSMSHTSPAQNRAGIELLHQALREDSTFASAWADLARRYYFVGMVGTANYVDSGLRAANRAIVLDPDLAFAHFARGDALTALGQVVPARLAYFKAIELDPNNTHAMEDLALLEALGGRFDESLYWAMRAVPLEPNHPMTYYHVAGPLNLLGDDAASERWLTEAIRRFPESTRLGMMMGSLDFIRGRGGAALRRARSIIQAHPNDNEPPLLLVDLVVLMHAPDAEAVVESLYREIPEGQGWILWESIRSLYALVLARRGDRARADSLWSEALRVAEARIRGGDASSSPPLEVAAVYAIRGDTGRALEWFDRAYQAGWREPRNIARDPFFDGVRAHPRFREIVARAEADVAAMRRRAEQAHPALFGRSR